LLKLIEEPPEKTILLLITENEDQIINTILSRCQVVKLFPLSETHIKDALVEREHISESEALKISHQANGNWNKAIQILHQSSNEEQFEKWFEYKKPCIKGSDSHSQNYPIGKLKDKDSNPVIEIMNESKK
jgi:DNA polymerase-3 subunit delta'